jgi:hypothetical protein
LDDEIQRAVDRLVYDAYGISEEHWRHIEMRHGGHAAMTQLPDSSRALKLLNSI